jgi:pimeloyl-ACP methyl ester carboxylesterase
VILNAVAQGEGPPVALLHGLFGQAGNFGAIQKRLSRHFRVIALDLRNHGASPHAPGMDYPTMAADVLETLHHHDAAPCALVGHSMGGKVAMAAALAEPQAVSRLVVADIAPVRYPPAFADYVRAMAAIKLHPGLTRADADAALAGVVEARGVRGFLLQNLRLGPEPGWKLGLTEIAAGLADIEDWKAQAVPPYRGPTLFVGGDGSDYIRAEHRPLIAALFPAAKFVTLKHAGHWLHADNPDGFVAVIEAFFGAASLSPTERTPRGAG